MAPGPGLNYKLTFYNKIDRADHTNRRAYFINPPTIVAAFVFDRADSFFQQQRPVSHYS